LLRQYRETIEQDATIRIGSDSLEIDTARYHLAPGVRAIGVRMHIGYSPGCAEGGESDYLTLFVENGSRIEAVLRQLPMSMWRITSGYHNCGYADENTQYTEDNLQTTLELAPTSTEGWKDLNWFARITSTDEQGNETISNKKLLATLRAHNRQYEVPPTHAVLR